MNKRTMYEPQKDSPTTFTMGDINGTDTFLTVGNSAMLPQTLPFPLTLGIDESITETVTVTAVDPNSNQLTIVRDITQNRSWLAGTTCGRVFTAADLKNVQDNVSDVIDQSNSNLDRLDTTLDPLVTVVGDSESGLVKDLDDEVSRAQAAESAEVSRAQAAESAIDAAKINRTELPQIITDWDYTADGTELVVTIQRYDANGQNGSSYTKTIPVGDDTNVGAMSPEVYNEVTALRTDVEALQQQGGRFIGQSFSTKADLDSYSIPNTVKTGDFTYVLDDETQSGATTRYIFDGTVFGFGYVIEHDVTVHTGDVTGGVALTIATGAVTTAKIADGNVTAAKIGSNAVITAKIADGNVTAAKIGSNAVTTPKIADGNVTAGKIGSNAVTTVKIADGNVTAPKIGSNAITTAKIANNAVTTAKIATGAVTANELSINAVTTDKLATDSVTAAKIAANAVGASEIAANAVGASEIAANAVTNAKIASNAVTAAKIASNAVTTAKIANNNVTLAKMAGITKGQIIVGDTSNNPSYLGGVSDGGIFIANGSSMTFTTSPVFKNNVGFVNATMTGSLTGATSISTKATGFISVWNDSNGYAIDMKNDAYHHYGPVYGKESIKISSYADSNNHRGITFGRHNFVPVAALDTLWGNFQTAGYVDARGGLKSRGVSGGIYVPLTAYPTNSTIQSLTAKGTYLCDLNDWTFASGEKPADLSKVKAWHFRIFARWQAPNSPSIWAGVSYKSTDTSFVCGLARNIGGDTNGDRIFCGENEGIVSTNGTGKFYLIIHGHDLAYPIGFNILGYFI